jgi:hypothetical protein
MLTAVGNDGRNTAYPYAPGWDDKDELVRRVIAEQGLNLRYLSWEN